MLIVRDLERESRPSRSADIGPEVEGSPYITEYFSSGSLTLYREERKYQVNALRYDVHRIGLDLRLDQQIKYLDGSLVKEFEYTDSLTTLPKRFVNGKDLTREGAPLRGFLEVLCWGKVDVYAYLETTLLKPNYNMAIGSGNKNYQIVRKRTLLYSPGTELRPLSKKELSKLWAERETEMAKFQKINKLNPTRERDLMLMVDYFNTL